MLRSHKITFGFYLLVWSIMAINPKYPDDWLLENVLVFIMVPLILWLDSRNSYSLTAVLLLVVFASLHSLGSHYTYAEMEHFNAITQWFDFERNHFDRLVHFLFGLLAFRMLFEMITPGIASIKVALAFTFTAIVTISTLYESLEWIAAAVLHPELGIAFLGTQGDVWDAQKDTLLATLGAAINLLFYKSYAELLHPNKSKHR